MCGSKISKFTKTNFLTLIFKKRYWQAFCMFYELYVNKFKRYRYNSCIFTIWYIWAVFITFIIQEHKRISHIMFHIIWVTVMLKWLNWCNESSVIWVGVGSRFFNAKLMRWSFEELNTFDNVEAAFLYFNNVSYWIIYLEQYLYM